MAHLHGVYDSDKHFQIDGVTRVVKNVSSTKTMVVQHDHNSERFTFELPRYIDGHDMSACNVVQVHYINIDPKDKKGVYRGVYEVDDLQVSPENGGVVICSWLISSNATQYVGNLSFIVRFACISGDGHVDYVWNTAKHSNVYVTEGIYNGKFVAEEYADILAQWKRELVEAGVDALTLDKTLLVEGEAADARATGDAIRALDNTIKRYRKTIHTTDDTIIEGAFITAYDDATAGTEVQSGSWVCSDFLPLEFDEGTEIVVQSVFFGNGGICFYDKDKNVLLAISGNRGGEYGLDNTYFLQKLSIIPPVEAEYVRLSAVLELGDVGIVYTQPSDLYVEGHIFNGNTKLRNEIEAVKHQIEAVEDDVNDLSREIAVSTEETNIYVGEADIVKGAFITAYDDVTAGTEAVSASYVCSKPLPLEFDADTQVTVRSHFYYNCGICFYDKNHNALLAISGNNGSDYGIYSSDQLQTLTITPPDGAKYVRLSAYIGDGTNYTEPGDLYVRYVTTTCDSNFVSCMNQTFTEPQKKKARENVGAISVEDVLEILKNYKIEFDCSAYGLPVLYLDGDNAQMTKDDSVDLQYRYKDLTGTASVKWQGSSSLSYPKKNYTVKFDVAFEASDGWGAQKKYCMKANYIDFTHSRNVVSAKLWGQIVASRRTKNAALNACPNFGAVDGFPICIVMNGEYYGVYTFNIPKDGWMMNMGSGTKECILCADAHTASNAFYGEATLDGDFDIEYITDENDTDWARVSLNRLINACVNSDGSDLDTTIAAMLDWESAIDYYIFVALLRGEDMVTKNYLINTYDGIKWFFGAYDLDSTYGLHWDGSKFLNSVDNQFEDLAAAHRVFQLIRTYKSAELKERYRELRKTVMSEDNVALLFRNFTGAISRPLLDEDNRKWPGIPNTNANSINQILDWYRLRVAAIDAEVENM